MLNVLMKVPSNISINFSKMRKSSIIKSLKSRKTFLSNKKSSSEKTIPTLTPQK